MIDCIGILCLCIGVFFVFTGSLGVARFQDVYLRLQASSKSITFGLGFLMVGIALVVSHGEVAAKATLAILFQFLTAPIAAQTLARAAMIKGQKPVKMDDNASMVD
jgi:multicomponent Na+:H+ antiporter subunit G